MAIFAPTISTHTANAHSWLHRAFAHFFPAALTAPAARSIEMTIVDLRLILRRIEHAGREHARWDARYLSQTIGRAVVAPLQELDLDEGLSRLRHGAVFALRPLLDVGVKRSRSDTDIDAELDEAAALIRAAIVDAETIRDLAA